MVPVLHDPSPNARVISGRHGMFWQQKKKREIPTAGIAALAIGTTVGVATAVYMGLRSRRGSPARRAAELNPQLVALEESVVDALAADEVAGHSPIEVEAIASGIIELSGTVDTAEAAHRVVEVTQSVPGVRTVLNRMDISADIAHLDEARRRAASGEPSLGGTRWYGVGAGMGVRRQSASTDPDRPNEKIHRITREYEAELQMDNEPGQPRVGGAGETGGAAVDL
jgi:hypothetical protein